MKKRKYFYYIYRIIFLKGSTENRYYLGKRTYYGFEIAKDNYTGSGLFCFAYFKKYGAIEGKTYIKEIIEINPDQETNRIRESYGIGNKYKTDPLCMNLIKGGKGDANHDTLCYVQDKYKKDIAQYDLYGNFIKSGHGIREASRELGVNRTGIQSCLSNRKPSAFGYQGRYGNGTEDPIEPYFKILPIIQYTINGNYVAEFDSPCDAKKETGISSGSIKSVCEGKRITAGDYVGRYKNDSFDKYRTEAINPKDKNRIYEKKIRPILAYDKDENFVKEFENIFAAIEGLGKGRASMFYQVANGKRKSAYGYIGKFKENVED